MTEYYANKYVRQRIVEFLGGSSLDDTTAVYITATDDSPIVRYDPKPISDLWRCLDAGLDICRSLWDRESLIVHLDIDYVNFVYPGEPHINPGSTFDIQKPVVKAIQETLPRHGIVPLHLLSGQGHHFVWRIHRNSTAFKRFAAFGRLPQSLQNRYDQPHPPNGEIVGREYGSAFAGLSLVLEFLAHRILEMSASECEVPVQLTAVEVGSGEHGRVIVSIDLSEYGDALHQRIIRIPFSIYLKPQRQRAILGEQVVSLLPPLFLIPLHEMDERQGLLVMRDFGQVTELARRATTYIPDQSWAMESLINDYTDSKLARFHDWFYSEKHEPFWDWPNTYDKTPMNLLPPCAQRILQQPNDLLVKPAGIQHIVRVMLALDWHPRHIAGLIRSKYERDYGWGDYWYHYDASSRADFYTRIFSGLFMVGLDDLVDFNCKSTQEKGYCADYECRSNLIKFRDSLLARRKR